MKSTCLAVLLAVTDATADLDSTFDLISPLVCVANKPLVTYPLEFLCQNQLEEVIIVTSHAWENELKTLVEQTVGERLRIHFLKVEHHTPSMECLKRVCEQEVINGRDLLVVPFNLICGVSFREFDLLHHTNNSTITLLLSHKLLLPETPLPKKYKKQEREVIVFSGGELVHLATETSMDGKLTLKPSLLKNACSFEVHSDLVDCHFYLISNRCLPCLATPPLAFKSLSREFVPWLVNNSFDKTVHDCLTPKRKFTTIKQDEHSEASRLVVKALVRADCMRVHDVASYCAANFELCKRSSGDRRPSIKGLSACAQSKVAEGVEITGKVSLKSTVVGARCSLANSSLDNCIIMSHAIIQQNVRLKNCIVSESSIVAEGSCLLECLVAPGQIVSTGTYSNKEFLPCTNETLCSSVAEAEEF